LELAGQIMAAEIISHTGNIVTVTITDMLSYPESAVLQKSAGADKAISVCY
jgi:hypothetical protein